MSEFLFTSESVSEGHPDKVADQISDAVLDAILEHDPTGRVAAETLVSTGLVVMAGEITTSANIDYARVARDTIPVEVIFDCFSSCSAKGVSTFTVSKQVAECRDPRFDVARGKNDSGLTVTHRRSDTS